MQNARYFFVTLLLSLPFFLQAQSPGIPQLRQQFETTDDDSIRINSAKRLFAQYVYTQVDSAIFFAEQVTEIGERLQLPKEILTGNNYLGIAYSIKGDFDKAGEYMEETYRLNAEAADSLNMAYALNNLGLNYTYAGDFLKAAENLLASARIKEALLRSGTSSADADLASTLLNIGIAYQNQKDTTQAAIYLGRSISEAESIGNVVIAARSRVSLGLLFIEQERYVAALGEMQKAEVVLDSLNDQFSLGKLYNSMALAHAELEDAGKTSSYATRSIELNQQIGNAQSEALGRVYLGLGHIKSGRYTLAIRESNIALKYGEANGSNDVKLGALKNLSEAYAALGNYKQAYEYALRYKAVDEVIFGEERSEQIERMSAQYEAEKRLIEIDNLNKETEVQALQLSKADSEKRQLFTLVGSLIIIVVLVAWFSRRILASRRVLQSKNEELDQLNSTKDRFFAIISHDLRSYINAFRGNGKLMKHLLKKQDTEKLDQVSAEIDKNAQNLSDLLDNLLQWSVDQLQGYEPKPEVIDIAPMVEDLVESYQHLAEAKGLALRSEISADAKALADRNGLSVIMRNLVANAIKFTDQGEVLISEMRKDNEQVVAVKDTGVGIPESIRAQLFAISEDKIRQGTRNEKGTGLGLNLANEFALANNGRLEVESAEGEGTTFLIYLPYA